jgi:hypothetical protein
MPLWRSVTPSATIAGPRRASPYLPRVGLSHDSRQRGHASCEVRALSSEAPDRPNQGARVGRTPVGQLDGQSEESCVPGRNKPLTFLAWLTCDKVAPIGFLRLAGVFFCDSLKRREVGRRIREPREQSVPGLQPCRALLLTFHRIV